MHGHIFVQNLSLDLEKQAVCVPQLTGVTILCLELVVVEIIHQVLG